MTLKSHNKTINLAAFRCAQNRNYGGVEPADDNG